MAKNSAKALSGMFGRMGLAFVGGLFLGIWGGPGDPRLNAEGGLNYAALDELGGSGAMGFSQAASKARYEVFQDTGGAWRWRLVTADGQVAADSGEGFDTRDNCERALAAVIALQDAPVVYTGP